MQAADIVAQLRNELPRHDDRFTDTVSITSLVESGGVVTATTSGEHGLADGADVSIVGVKTATDISSMTFLDGVVSCVTATDHDLTEFSGATVEILGATETDYNGTFDLDTSVNRLNFTYSVTGTPTTPATGSPVLLEDRIDGYNGYFNITVTSLTTFTYVRSATGTAILTNAVVTKNPRIARALNDDRAISAYTAKVSGKFALFVSLTDAQANRDRSILSDQTVELQEGGERRIHMIRPFQIYLFIPQLDNNDVAGGSSRDLAEDVVVNVIKSIVGFKPLTQYADPGRQLIGLVNHGYYSESPGGGKAYYIHVMNFEWREDIVEEDQINILSRSWRDTQLDYLNVNKVAIMEKQFSMDDEVL